jgi:hypothetical protein
MVAVASFRGELTASEYRAGLALAEAIIPGSARIPAADETTFERSEDAVRDFHPSAVRPWRMALRALDAAAVAYTGRPFHTLGARRQEALIVRWQTDPVLKSPLNLLGLIYKFVHFDRDDIYGAMGG